MLKLSNRYPENHREIIKALFVSRQLNNHQQLQLYKCYQMFYKEEIRAQAMHRKYYENDPADRDILTYLSLLLKMVWPTEITETWNKIYNRYWEDIYAKTIDIRNSVT